jgi:MarR family transcriptional repressor of emrRAB
MHPGPRLPALIELLRTAETLWQSSRPFFARWQLSPSQFNVLNLLHLSPAGLTQSELSRQLLMHRSNLTSLVDQLEARLLVSREQVVGDRRAHRVALAPTGRRLMRELLPAYHQGVEAVLADLSVREAQRFADTCQQITARANTIAGAMAAESQAPHED